ncbi:helix-turn-helix transcriptional regulator [Methylobacterium aquaticum]|jgi:DNA-binding CsgD family transcriptional regulator|nr:helix-turn-helix transcriptional regulator [Methylobacterium aquaticum]
MTTRTPDDLIDTIYEAAFIPALWPSLLDDLSARTGGWGGMLFTATPEAARWTASAATSDFFTDFLANGWMERNPLVERGVKRDHAGFLTDLDLFTIEEIEAEPMYRDMRRLGGGWHLGTAIAVPNGDTLVINIERRHRTGPFGRDHADHLDAFRPHLCRAALLAARQSQARIDATIDNLELLGLAAGALTRTGKLLASNALLANAMPTLIEDGPSRIRLRHKPSDDLLVEALATSGNREAGVPGRSIPIPASAESPPSILHMVPMAGASRDLFSRASVLMVVTTLAIGTAPDARLIRGLFDLTPAESKIARDIATGMSIPEIALRHGLSGHTVRTQVKAIFSKTGVHRQSELSALLNGIPLL